MAVTAQTNTTLEEIAQVIKDNNSFVVCGHIGPDGDCIGSQLSLAHALKELGKTVTVTTPTDDALDPAFSFLPGFDSFVPASQVTDSFDVFVGVDVPTRERLGQYAPSLLDSCALSVTIDHHAVDTTMCTYVYVDPQAASTTTLIWQLEKILFSEPPVSCALCAYTGLVTDTGCFQFQNVDKNAFEAAAQMVEAGANPALVAKETMHNRTLPSLRLESRIIDRMEFFCGGACVLSWVTLDDMRDCEAQKPDTDPLINAIRQIRGVRVACVLREENNLVKGSFRAKDDTDVSVIARRFGGGGHTAAAGFTIEGTIDEARDQLRETLRSLFR